MRRTLSNVPKGYDSWLEWDLAQELKGCQYHPCAVPYVQHRHYHPDFTYKEGDITYYIEAKGRFRDKPEARKYVDVKKALNTEEELVFVFQNPDNRMPDAKRRKDGTFYCMRDWAERNEFKWYTPKTIPEEWKCDT